MSDFKIVVIGGSAGAVEGCLSLAGQLPADINAAVFIVVHLSPSAPSAFAELLSRRGAMTVHWARDGAVIRPGHMYVAAPDQHMLIASGHIVLGRGPRENGHRPAIDPLFRTAAHTYHDRVIGVVLSGNLDDGSAGLAEIRQTGGKAIVLDPADAAFNSMPLSAIQTAGADAIVAAADLTAKILEFIGEPATLTEANTDMANDIAAGGESPMSADEREDGHLSPFGCPDCGGALWEIQDSDVVRFRCRVGHAYTQESLLEGMTEGVERAMWAALRALEEQAAQANRLAQRMKARQHENLAQRFRTQAIEADERAAIIRSALLKSSAA